MWAEISTIFVLDADELAFINWYLLVLEGLAAICVALGIIWETIKETLK